MRKIDFLVIGTQKGGTKSLYHHLKCHPMIFVPYAYEVAFFCFDDQFSKGVSWYLNEYFSGSLEAQMKLGEVSPQYMSAPYSAERIHRYFPDVRLIAILRNPIDRAYSAYRMMVRKTREKRSFDEAIARCEAELTERGADIGPKELLNEYEYLRTGFYGCILEKYLKLFQIEQVKVLFTEQLNRDPAATLRVLYEFIGVDDSLLPENYSQRFHEGGAAKYPLINAFLESSFYRKLVAPIKPMIPKRMRMLSYRIEQWNVKSSDSLGLTPDQRLRLASIFRKDVDLLEQTFKLVVPWADFGRSFGSG